MCGIAGVINGSYFNKDAEQFIRDALTAGVVRGMDSTGIFQQDKDGKLFYDKSLSVGPVYAKSAMGKRFCEDATKAKATVIHHRAATQGEIVKANAHPFVVHKENGQPLVGVHNGSLIKWKEKKNADLYEVDSNWALDRIAALGTEAFRAIEGPYAFVWATADEPDCVFMCRNSQRPLHILFSKDRKEMYFASESGMLSWLTDRAQIKTEETILSLVPNKLYRFNIKRGEAITYTKSELPTPWSYNPANRPVVAQPSVAQQVAGQAAVPLKDYRPSGYNRAPYNPQPKATTLNAAGHAFIDGIKAACKGQYNVGRVTPQFGDEHKVADKKDDEPLDLVAAVTAAVEDLVGDAEADIVEQSNDDAPFDDTPMEEADLVPTSWFQGGVATPEERKLALSQGFYRDLQWFTGVVFDEDSDELIGDVEIFDKKKKGKTKYVAIMKGISRNRASAEYINNKTNGFAAPGNWCVIVGSRQDKLLGNVFILEELNREGKAELAKARALSN